MPNSRAGLPYHVKLVGQGKTTQPDRYVIYLCALIESLFCFDPSYNCAVFLKTAPK